MYMNKCSPHIASPYDIVETCFDKPMLIKIAKQLNLKGYNINTNTPTTKVLWNNIRKVLASKCKDDEICWLKESNNESHLNYYFRPKKPKGQFEWLSNFDIEEIMKQYENKYNKFKFFGALPSDFSKIRTPLNNQYIHDLVSAGKTKYGIIFNTDPSTKSGQHWVSFYMDLDDQSVEYCDSLGHSPFKTVNEYINNLILYSKVKYNIDLVRKCNKKKFQQRYDGDCGVYSINYIVARLNGRSFEDIINTPVDEDEFNTCRNYYFRN